MTPVMLQPQRSRHVNRRDNTFVHKHGIHADPSGHTTGKGIFQFLKTAFTQRAERLNATNATRTGALYLVQPDETFENVFTTPECLPEPGKRTAPFSGRAGIEPDL